MPFWYTWTKWIVHYSCQSRQRDWWLDQTFRSHIHESWRVTRSSLLPRHGDRRVAQPGWPTEFGRYFALCVNSSTFPRYLSHKRRHDHQLRHSSSQSLTIILACVRISAAGKVWAKPCNTCNIYTVLPKANLRVSSRVSFQMLYVQNNMNTIC